MINIKKCPVCSKNPVVCYKDDEERVRIMCCKFVVYTVLGWNQYAVAMRFAKAIVCHADEMNNEEDTYDNQADIVARHVEDLEKKVLEVFGK